MSPSSPTAPGSGLRYANRSPRGTALKDRIARWTDRSGECWIWLGGIDPYGYGRITIDGKRRKAHRASYVEFVGVIPDGLELDHVCHNRDLSCVNGGECMHRRCVNPNHLEPVTHTENVRRSAAARVAAIWGGRPPHGQDTCIHGHLLNEANWRITQGGHRYCLECHRIRGRAFAQRKRDANTLAAAQAQGNASANGAQP